MEEAGSSGWRLSPREALLPACIAVLATELLPRVWWVRQLASPPQAGAPTLTLSSVLYPTPISSYVNHATLTDTV